MNHLKTMALGLALVGWVSVLNAQTNILLVPFDQVWRFNESGANLGTAWTNATYNDTAAPWQSGPGLLGFETGTVYPEPIRTPVAQPSVSGVITIYFRTYFVFPTNYPTAGVTFLSSNYLDDGAVFYLNGMELYRFRVPAGQTFSTQANGQPPTEGVVELMNFSAASLRHGTNVLAVELHQNGTASSDAVFGMNLLAMIPPPSTPLVITNQPDNTIGQAGRTATFTVGVSGSNPFYRWFSSNSVAGFVAISGAAGTNFASYTTPTLNTGMSGTSYRVVVSNSLGSVTSTVAVLTVVPDVFGPRMLHAVITNDNQVHMVFDEPILRLTGTNHDNYAITVMGTTNRVEISRSNQIQFATTVLRLTTVTNLSCTNRYILTMNNLTDIRTNFIAPNSQITLSCVIVTNVIPFGSEWSIAVAEIDDYLGRDWIQPNYDDSDFNHWGVAPGMFFEDQTPGWNPTCTTRGTIINDGPITYYYRRKFVLPQNPGAGVSLGLHRVVDDGAIFYLNGAEILRERMPQGAVTYFTRATQSVDGSCVNSSVTVNNLVAGTNTLAVEVHQFTDEGFNNDTSFDAEVTVQYLSSPALANPPRPRLNISRLGPSTINLRWTNGPIHIVNGNGFALESADKVTGPWLEVQPMSTNLVISASTAAQFYRLRLVRGNVYP